MLAGGAILLVFSTPGCFSCEGHDDEGTIDMRIAGAGLAIVGGVVTAVGIPMFVVGGREVPFDDDRLLRRSRASVVPELRISPSKAALRWSF